MWPMVISKRTRSLDPEYLSRKCVLLEKLINQLVFESPSLTILEQFLVRG